VDANLKGGSLKSKKKNKILYIIYSTLARDSACPRSRWQHKTPKPKSLGVSCHALVIPDTRHKQIS